MCCSSKETENVCVPVNRVPKVHVMLSMITPLCVTPELYISVTKILENTGILHQCFQFSGRCIKFLLTSSYKSRVYAREIRIYSYDTIAIVYHADTQGEAHTTQASSCIRCYTVTQGEAQF